MVMKAPQVNVSAGAMLAGVALLAGAAYVIKMGGLQNAIAGGVSALMSAAGSAVSGAVGAVGAAVGLPTPSDTTTDAKEARWLIDNRGQLVASQWASAPAYLEAQFMQAGTGNPPSPTSPAGRAFGLTAGDFARADRYTGPVIGELDDTGTGRDLGAPGWAGTPTP